MGSEDLVCRLHGIPILTPMPSSKVSHITNADICRLRTTFYSLAARTALTYGIFSLVRQSHDGVLHSRISISNAIQCPPAT